jgi:hypothetical protein
MFLSENWLHVLHFSENSHRLYYAADASVYLVNIKGQIYYAAQKNVLFFYNWSSLFTIHKMSVRNNTRGTAKYAVF